MTVSGGGEVNTANDSASDVTTVTQAPDLTITKTHVGNFTQGQVGATYTLRVNNLGPGPTNGTVTVVDTLPTGLRPRQSREPGWACTLCDVTCTRNDVLALQSSYPAITLTVTVASNATASRHEQRHCLRRRRTQYCERRRDVTRPPSSQFPDMTITKSHIGNFTQGQVGATYTITATNSGTATTQRNGYGS